MFETDSHAYYFTSGFLKQVWFWLKIELIEMQNPGPIWRRQDFN